MKEDKTLKQKWIDFLGILLSPGSIIPLVITGISLYASVKSQGLLSYGLSIFAAIMSAIAGYFIKDDWDKFQGNSTLQNKGRSAIRNLESIGQQVEQIRGWIKEFSSKRKLSDEHLQEVDRHLTTAQLHITSGLEDWIDIVPELREREEIRKHYEDTVHVVVEEVLKNKKELALTQEDTQKREQLEKRIMDLENNLRDLKKPGAYMLPRIPIARSFQIVRCNICGNQYPAHGGVSDPINNICPRCRIKPNIQQSK